MRMLVVGAGSTGGYFGDDSHRRAETLPFSFDLTARNNFIATVYKIISPNGDVTLTPQLTTASSAAAAFDIVLLTVKAYALESALADVAPFVGRATMILPVLNGMKPMDALVARFGRQRAVGCTCKVATTLDAVGRIVQMSHLQEIAYGECDGAPSARMCALDRFMQGAGFNARLSTAIEREMWEKWIMLASLGGINCLMRADIGQVESAPGGPDFALAFLSEVTSVVRKVGKPPSDESVAAVTALITQKGSTQTSSMYRDLQSGRPIEADAIIGDLLARAHGAGMTVPLLAAAYTHLSIYQVALSVGAGRAG